MKQNKLFFGLATIAAAALSFAACSSDEPETSPRQQETKTISFTSSLEGSKAGTRAASNLQATQIVSGVKVGIFGVGTGGTLTNNENIEYTADGSGGLTTNSAMTCTSECTKIDFYAYAPKQDNWSYNSANSFSVQTDQSAEAGYLASDLLCATSASITSPADNSTVALAFTHKLSKVNIQITRETGASIDLTGATVKITGTKNGTTLNPSTGEIATVTGDAAVEITVAKSGTTALAANGGTVSGIIIPQTVSSGTALVSIEIDSHTLIASLGADQTFVAGETYTFSLSIGDFGSDSTPSGTRTLGTPTTSISADWTDGTESSTESNFKWATAFSDKNWGSNAKYESSTYKWWAGTDNLMTLISGSAGDFKDYKTLHITVSDVNYSKGIIRIRIGDTNIIEYDAENGPILTAGHHSIDISSYAATMTDIKFGGGGTTTGASSESPFSVGIKASDVYLSKD